MTRYIHVVVLTACLFGCVATHTYLYYEVLRDLEQLKVGDEVRVILRGGDTVVGTVLRMRESALVIASKDRGERSVSRQEIQVLERVRKTTVKDY